MEVDDKDADYSEVMNDPAFLQSVLQVRLLWMLCVSCCCST